MIPNYETVSRQALVLAICHDLIMAAIKSVGSVNTTDDSKLNIVVRDELFKALSK